MKSPEEYRQAILAEIKRAYRVIRRYEKLLASKPLTRVYKNPNCKSAEKQMDRINDIKSELDDEECILVRAWKQLPEITDKKVIDMLALKAFAAKLCKPQRNPRFLKNQSRLELDP